MSEVVLEMKNVTKRFPGVIALKEVSIAVEKGEVMAICGENGAGKSTLMKVLSGSYSHKEYEGEIWINGKREEFSCISDAERCGIEMVYQELNMILVASVAENLYVGNLPGNGAFVDWKKLYEKDLPVPFVGLEWIYDTQLPEVKSKEDTSQFSAEFTNLPLVSPSSYNRPYTEEISFPVTMKKQNQNQGFSYGPYARELENEEPGPMHLGSDSDDNSYVSASVSEYSDDDMMEDSYI